MALDDRMLDEAAGWAVRTGDPSFDDWDGFTLWLEAAPAHAEAYERVTASIADAADKLAELPRAVNDDQVAGASRKRWIGGGLGVVLTAVIAMGVWQMRPGDYSVETAPGVTRLVQLDGGGTITLAGGSKVMLDRRDPRVAVVEAGEALFAVRHDTARPFTVKIGDKQLVDVGTVFDVKRDETLMTVAVSEGAVVFNPLHQNVRVDPGHQLSSVSGSTDYNLSEVPVEQVGEWRVGRLTFQDATLASVAGDLSRATGMAFSAAPGAASRRVSGSLLLDPVRADPRSAGPLLGVSVRANGDGWVLEVR